MWGIEAAILVVTCAAMLVAIWTAPLWMRVLTGFISRLWEQLGRTDADVVITEKEIPKEEK